ncbi:MAG TPA: Rrf2 family transcriptional regulator [Anaerolineales bacterium]|jgi:Rrf2 family protein
MLRINRQTDYAVRVILALAAHDGSQKVSSAQVRDAMLIPASFMPRIVAQLAKFKLIKTFTGRDGGLLLSRPANEITLRDVVEAFEGPILLSECMQAGQENDCPFLDNCQVRSKWGRVQAAMLREMASITFAELALETRANPPESFVLSSFL